MNANSPGVFPILGLCGILVIALCFIGFVTLAVAVRKGRSEFRTKGFLKPPSGKAWFRFLLWKQYDYFANPSTRFFFGVSHFCLMGTIVLFTAGALLLGSEVLLKGVSGVPMGGMWGSKFGLSK